MNFKFLQKLPSVEEIIDGMPLKRELKEIKEKRDKEIAGLFKRENKRFLLLVGPCSAHDEDALCEYVARLSKLQERVQDKIIITPRIYTNKPRSKGTGYKGMFHQPDHQKRPNMVKGLKAIRRMHIRALSESHLTAADEMLYPGNYPYLEDLLAYVAIGARSVENQQHRLTVSGLDVPVGMKNPTAGDLSVMLDSIQAAQEPHVFVYNGWEVSTEGNDLVHAVIRGSVDRNGNHIPNYHYEDLIKLTEMYNKRGLSNPSIIVDTNHSNSGKKHLEQPRIAMEVIRSMQQSPMIKDMVVGLMIESYILDGSQDPSGNEFGRSITDPCLGWEQTERLILDLADMLD